MSWFTYRGYYCIRAYASHGVFDFLAVPPKTFLLDKTKDFPKDWNFEKPYMVQAKTNGYVKPLERQTLINAEKKYNGVVIIAYREGIKILFKSVPK